MDGVASGPLRCNGKVRVVEGEIPFELHGLEHAGDKVPCCDLTGLREQAVARRRRPRLSEAGLAPGSTPELPISSCAITLTKAPVLGKPNR